MPPRVPSNATLKVLREKVNQALRLLDDRVVVIERTVEEDTSSSVESSDVEDTVLYDVNFAALPNNTFSAANEVIDNKTWSTGNLANATVFEILHNTGLHFDAAAVDTEYNTTTRSATNVNIAIGSLISDWDPLREYVFEVYFSSLTLGTSGDRVLICLDNTIVAGANRLLGGGIRNNAGNLGPYSQREAVALQGNTHATHDAVAIKIGPRGVTTFSGVYSGDFPEFYDGVGGSFNHTEGAQSVLNPLSRLVIAFVTGGAGGAMDAAVGHLRIKELR